MMSGFHASLTLNIRQLCKLGWVCQIRVTDTQFYFIKNSYIALDIMPDFPISSASCNYGDNLALQDHSGCQIGYLLSDFFKRIMKEFGISSFIFFSLMKELLKTTTKNIFQDLVAGMFSNLLFTLSSVFCHVT